jgi:murein DD-endopeptidase MepM/ murein hydrolase activator NlpD
MKRALSLVLMILLVFPTISILQIDPVMAATDEYFIYSRFDPPSIGDVVGAGGYVEYYGVPEWGDEIQYVYFLSGYTGYKVKVTVTDGDGDGKIEPRQHPSHYLSEYQGPIEPRNFEISSSKDLSGYTSGSSTHTEEFYVDSGGLYLGAYPNGINKWDHDWKYLGKIANSPPTRTESMAYNPAENVWYAGGRYRTIYQLSDTDNDGSFLDESWTAIFTYPNYGGSHHDGMEYVGGYLWISDMTSDVIGKWEYDTATSTWKELKRFTYTETADVEGMGFGPNDHFWCGSGWGSESYIYELGNEITKGYPIANAGPDVDAFPPTIPVRFYAGGSHHTDPAKEIALYEWDFESDGTWDYSFGRFVYPTGLTPTAPNGKLSYGYDGACTYYEYAGWLYAGWLARFDKGHYPIEDRYHLGQDIPAKDGDNVYAIADGEIIKLQFGGGWGDGNYALAVKHTLDTGENFVALYGHVRPNSDLSGYISSGDVDPPVPVAAGEAFATIGPLATTHLHFGIHPDLAMPLSHWGMMPLTSWPDPNASPGDPNGPDTNGFLDPIEWIITRTPLTSVPLYVDHTYPAYYNPDGSIDWDRTAKDYTATLRVTDNSDPALQDTDTCIVHITRPPWKPVADPNGPYEGFAGSPVQLDGLQSYDPESRMFPPDHPWYETIATYEWDLDDDGEFDDATGASPTHTWSSEGLYTIGLKVTDSQPSGPGDTFGPLDMDTKHTTVVITKVLARVTVTIVEVRAIDTMDPIGPWSAADFYAKVTIDGQSLPDSSIIGDRDDIYPESETHPWTFTHVVSKAEVPIRIEIWESDPWPSPDDHIDIDKDSSDRDLDLSFDVTDQSLSGDVAYGYSRGGGDSNRAEIWFNVGVGTGDKDGDGLFDSWETLGIHMDNDDVVDLDLKALGAKPDHKDIFLEIDWMQTDTHSHKPRDEVSQAVIDAFKNAPVLNLDGESGINLHIDESNSVAEEQIISFSFGGGIGGSDFDRIKSNNFDQNRRFAYHYCLFAHYISVGISVSGIAELPGNDFIVSLGGWGVRADGTEGWTGNPDDVGTSRQQKGTLMHEFGHNLGLHHGGDDDINYKPNYLSIMTYTFQMTGIPPTNRIDYSRYALPSLNEKNLDETVGIQDGADNTVFFNEPNLRRTGTGIGPIDWDGDNIIERNVRADINNGPNSRIYKGPEKYTLLKGYNDWANLILNMRTSVDIADGVHVTCEDLIELDSQIWTSMQGAAVIEKFAEGAAAVQLYAKNSWNLTYTITNVYDYEIYDLTVKDHFGANLDVAFLSSTKGLYMQYTNKPGRQQRFTWSIETLAPSETVTLILEVSTGLNPAQKQEFTSAGLKVLNSGANVKWLDGSGHQGSAESGQISIWAGVSVSDATGAIAGYAKNAITGEPLRGYVIELRDSTGTLAATTTTDKNGFYAFSSLAPTDYTVICSTESYTATVTAEQVKRIDFEFD